MIAEFLQLVGSTIQGCATIFAALIVGIAGGLISRSYSRERDRQDKEAQWREHAIELTKLDLERKLKLRKADDSVPLRPSILDFLANYRDLNELGEKTPKELYRLIKETRVKQTNSQSTAGGGSVEPAQSSSKETPHGAA